MKYLVGIILCFLLILIFISGEKYHQERTECEVSGGVYIQGKNNTQYCIKKESVIGVYNK